LITAEAFSERRVPNQAKTDCGDRRPKEAAGHTLQHKSGEDKRQARPKRQYQGTDDHNRLLSPLV
jgi:hypothetical protein